MHIAKHGAKTTSQDPLHATHSLNACLEPNTTLELSSLPVL
jgi:hypothetical protein